MRAKEEEKRDVNLIKQAREKLDAGSRRDTAARGRGGGEYTERGHRLGL